jgi:transcription elongation factor Elf1
MTERTCPVCTCVICIPVVDRDKKQTGWECTICGLEWTEKEKSFGVPHEFLAIDSEQDGRNL